MRKYLRVFTYAARDQVMYLPAFLVRNIFFVFTVFIFYSLWRVIFSGRPALAGFTMVQSLWYLTLTECIELSRGRSIHLAIEEEVKDGTVSLSLTRPFSYVAFHFSRALGESVVKAVPILIEGFLLALIMVGPLPGYFTALPFGLILIALGIVVGNLWSLLIGLLSFWMEEVSPITWLVQKLVFILGGLFIPIDFFPKGVAEVARWLPFAFSAYWPASTVVRFSMSSFLTGLGGALFYTAILSLASAGIFALGRRRIHANGG